MDKIDEVISNEEYSKKLKMLSDYCDDDCLHCDVSGNCHFSEIKK